MSDSNKFVAKKGIILKPFDGISQDAILKSDINGNIVTGATFNNLSNTAHTHLWVDITNSAHTHDERYYVKNDVYNTGETYSRIDSDLRYVNVSGDTMFGTLTVPEIISTAITSDNINTINISAQTIYNIDNMYFITGNTANTFIAGNLYYNNYENSLTYNPYTVNMDVAINIGQENLIRVYNNTGSKINNGQVCHINGTTDGTPTITLATGNIIYDNSEISGVATHDIQNESFGFITNFGIVRNLNITGTTPGSIIYLSDKIVGGFEYDINNINIGTRINKIGLIINTGATTGKILVDIRNENIILSSTDRELNALNGNNSSTGLIEFGGLTFSGTSATTFEIGSIKAWFVDNTTTPLTPIKTYKEFSATTGNTLPDILSQNVTYVAIDIDGVIHKSPTRFTSTQQRDWINLGVIVHSNRIYINAVNNQPISITSPLSQLVDLIECIGVFNISGNLFSANGTNLNIDKSIGSIFKLGSNFIYDKKDPHTITLPALTAPSNIRYRLQNSYEYADTNTVDPGYYDVDGVRTALSNNNKWTIQRIYLFQSNLVRIQYGQYEYDTKAEAIQGIYTEKFIVEQNLLENGLLRGLLIIKANTTNLANTDFAIFIEASKFGGTVGLGNLSTTSLQQAYNNSTTPEIAINSTLGGLSIINHAGIDSATTLIEGLSSGGTITSWIKANGSSSFLTLTSTTISAVTFYGNLNWNYLTNAPTTLSGYGITNAYTSSQTNANFLSASTTLTTLSGVSLSVYNTYTGITAPTLYLPYSISEDTHFTTGILDNGQHSTISFNSATTEFTISPTGTTFPVYLDGVRFDKTTQTIVLSGVSNWQPNKLFFVYFNSSACTLYASSTVWNILSTTAPVATIYWNGTSAIIGDERHGANRNLAWHKWAHETRGTAYKSGFDATFTDTTTLITSGILEDEDIILNIPQQTQFRIWITDVSNTATTFLNTVSDTSAYINGGALQYDNTGSSTAVSDGFFVKNYIYGSNDIDYPMALIVGQEQYSNVNDARNGSFPTFPSYISAETRLLYTTIWKNVGGTATFVEKSDFRTALTAPNGILGIRPTYLAELEDVISTTPAVDDTLRFNGVNWITGPTPTSAGVGISFYFSTPILTGITTNNTNPTLSLSKTPVTTTEQTTTVTVAIAGSLVMSAWLYDLPIGKNIIDAGTWVFQTYAGVSSTSSSRVSTITHGLYSVLQSATTITITGTGTTRTVTSNSGLPFLITNVTASATNTLASYLQTKQGLYQITARSSNTSITILTPTTYVNESAITFSIWRQLFNAITPTITAISPAYSLYSAISTQGAFTISSDMKLGSISFGTSNSITSRTITMSYNGTARNSYFTTPLVITHNQLTSLQGGIADQYYHLSLSEYNNTIISVPNTRTINNYALNSNIILNLSDIANSSHTHNEIRWSITTQTGTGYTATNMNYVLVSAMTHTVTLPSATLNNQVKVKVVVDPTNIQVKTPSTGILIDGVDCSIVGYSFTSKYDVFTFTADGTNWWID